MASLAAETRTAVDETPFIRDALRAGVLNFAAAARYLDVDGDEEAIATALRRYAEELPPLQEPAADVRVQMKSGVEGDLLQVDGAPLETGETTATAIIATGELDATVFGDALLRLANVEVPVLGAGLTDDTAVLLVPRRHGATALRLVENAAERNH